MDTSENTLFDDVRVIAFSGDRIGLLRLLDGVDATLLKPTEPAGVLKTLHEVCARSRGSWA